ncbi:conserved domain protein [Shigella boydii ATCC 9905]|nr:conserved domain protein [Shigella boydii ATCC 9905]
MPVWASPRGIAEKHQKAWLKVVCFSLPDAGLQVYAIWLSSRPDAPYFMPDAA